MKNQEPKPGKDEQKPAAENVSGEEFQNMQKSNDWLLTILKSIGDGFISTDGTGLVTYLNPEAERLTGWSYSEAKEKPIEDIFNIVHAESRQKEVNPVYRVLETGHKEGLANDTTLIARDGTEHQIADSAAPIKDDDGNINGVILIFYDITEQYRLRKRLSRNEELLRKTQEIARLGSWELDLTDNFLYWSDEVYRIFGLFPQEFAATYEAFLDMVHLDDRKKVDQTYWSSIRNGQDTYEVEHRIIRQDTGEERHVSEKCYHVRDNRGEVIRSVGMVQDITEQKERGKSLTRFRQALDSSADGIYLISHPSYRFVDANFPACCQLGYSRQELLELTPFDIKPSIPREELEEKFNSLLNSSLEQVDECRNLSLNCVETFETYHQRKDGSCFPVEVSLRLAEISEEKLFVASVRDISYRKEAENKLADYAMELEFKNLEIENLYQQLDHEVDKTRKLHENSLPLELPKIEGIAMAAHYQAALRLGGDFYQAFCHGNQLIFYLSDVSGHGMEGAIVSTFVKEAIECYFTLRPGSAEPQEVMNYLDERFRKENYPLDYFLSFFLGILDLETRELRFSGAGFHESLLLARKGENPVAYHVEGIPISKVIPQHMVDFQSYRLNLFPGDALLLNTDGLTEQMQGDISFEAKRWEIFQQCSQLPPEAIINAINEEFCKFNQGSLQGDDDITILALRLAPEDKVEYHWELRSTNKELEKLNSQIYQEFTSYLSDTCLFHGIHELVANAMEHGNHFDPEKKVWLTLEVTGQYLFVKVRDQGEGFAWKEKKNKPLDIDYDGERGRGIMIANHMANQLFYNPKGNQAFLLLPR